MEEYSRCDSECGGLVCMFHSLRPEVQAHIVELEDVRRRRHFIFNAAIDTEAEKIKHIKEHAKRGNWDDEKCDLFPPCFVHDFLAIVTFKNERERYWKDYLEKEQDDGN